MNRSFASKVGLLALVFLSGGGSAATAQATLRWKFQAGETLRYEFVQKTEIKIKAGDQETTNSTALTIDLTWKVREVAKDGTAGITLVVDRARVRIDAGPQKVRYDSKDDQPNADPAAQALQSVYSAAVGQDYALKVDARGQVVEVKVPEKVAKALRGSPFLAIADGGSVFSEKGVKNLLAQVIPVFPESPVSRGDTWKTELDLPVTPLRMVTTITDTLDSADVDSARIVGKIEAAIKPDADTAITVNVKAQSGTRAVAHNSRDGRLTSSTLKQSFDLTLGFMSKEIVQTIRIDGTWTLIP